jgi:hypothetical protein
VVTRNRSQSPERTDILAREARSRHCDTGSSREGSQTQDSESKQDEGELISRGKTGIHTGWGAEERGD